MDKRIFIVLGILCILPIVYGLNTWRTCNVGEECHIEEFVYNQNYTPVIRQVCTFNLTHENTTRLIINQNMTNNTDGSHNFTFIPTVAGYHLGEIFCQNGSVIGRFDKSFVVGECIEKSFSQYPTGFFLNLIFALLGILHVWQFVFRDINENMNAD